MILFEWKMKSPRSVFLSRIFLSRHLVRHCLVQFVTKVGLSQPCTHVSRAMSWGVWGRTVTFLVVGSFETVALGFCESGR